MSGHANCPNCAWAIQAAADLKLPPLDSWLLAIVAEHVSRFTLVWTGSAAKLAVLTRLSERKVRYILAEASKTGLAQALSIKPRKGIGLTIRLRRVSESETTPAHGAEVATPAPRADEPPTPAQRAATPAPRAVVTPAQRAETPLKQVPLESPQVRHPPNPPPSGGKVVRRKPRAGLPADWSPGPEGVAYAEERGINLDAEVPHFRDWHYAHGSLMADWPAAWRTWCDKPWRKQQALGAVRDPMQRDPNKLSGSPLAGYRFRQELAAARAAEQEDAA